MSDDLARLLDLPAAARLSVAGDELALLTLRHEHADKIIIERRRLGTSIDLHALFELIGSRGLADMPQLQVSEVAAPQLPAPVEDAPGPTARRTTRNQQSQASAHVCPMCSRTFKNSHALEVHQGRMHKEIPVLPEIVEPQSTPVPVPVITSSICEICDISLRFHECCADCQALLGPEHEAGTAADMLDDRPLCSVCVGYRETAEQLGVAA
jgi:hypothetical protein